MSSAEALFLSLCPREANDAEEFMAIGDGIDEEAASILEMRAYALVVVAGGGR
jgi:hypothetical protein